MKYGIDARVNCSEEEMKINNYIKEYMIKRIKDLGHIAIDCEFSKSKNFGEILYNKVKIANNTRVDLFLSINIYFDKTNNITLYTKGYDSEIMAENIIKSLDEFKFSSKNIINKSNLYLIKNINSQVLLANIKISNDNEEVLEVISEKIVKIVVV